MKKIVTLLICAAMLTSAALTACSEEKPEKKPSKQETTVNEPGNSSSDKETPTDTNIGENDDVVTEKKLLTDIVFEAETVSDIGAYAIDENYAKLFQKVESLEALSDADNNILANVEGIPMNEAAVRFAVISTANAFDDEEMIKKELLNYYVLNAAIIKQSKELGVEIDDDSFKQNIEAMQVYYKQYYGENYENALADSPYSPHFLYFNECYNVLFRDIFQKLSEDENSEIAKTARETAFEQTLNTLEQGNYIRAKHILISFPDDIEKDADGNIPESAKAETLAKANAVMAEVREISDPSEFDVLVVKYGQDPGMQSSPAGYYFTTGEMVPEFEEAAYALEEYGVSDPVETQFGYHIIQRLPYDVDTSTESSLMSNQTFLNAYNTVAVEKTRSFLFENAKDYEIVYSDKHQEAFEKYMKEYEEKWDPANQQSQTQE